MDAAHKHLREKLGMTDEHFDRVKKHLGDTMLEVPEGHAPLPAPS